MPDNKRVMTTPFIEVWKGLLISAALLKAAAPSFRGRPPHVPGTRYLKRRRRELAGA